MLNKLWSNTDADLTMLCGVQEGCSATSVVCLAPENDVYWSSDSTALAKPPFSTGFKLAKWLRQYPVCSSCIHLIEKNLWKSLTYEKLRMNSWLWKKSYKKLRMKLCKTYEKRTTALQVSYEKIKFAASDVVRKTLCHRLLLVEYFELKTIDNQGAFE